MKRSPHIHPCTTAAERDLAQRIADNVNYNLAESLFLESLCFALAEERQEEAIIKRQEGLTHVVLFGRFFITWCPSNQPDPSCAQPSGPPPQEDDPITVSEAAILYRYNERTLRIYQRCGHLPPVLTHGIMHAFIAGLGGYNRRPRGIERDRSAYRRRIRTAGPIRTRAARKTSDTAIEVQRCKIKVHQPTKARARIPYTDPQPRRSAHRSLPEAMVKHWPAPFRWYSRRAFPRPLRRSTHALPFGHGPPAGTPFINSTSAPPHSQLEFPLNASRPLRT